MNPDYNGYRFPPQIIGHAVWLFHRFTLSFRELSAFVVIVVSRDPVLVHRNACRWKARHSAAGQLSELRSIHQEQAFWCTI